MKTFEIYFVLCYFLSPLIISGAITGIIAFAKGRSFLAWFIYGFFVPVISQLHAIFCERKKKEQPSTQSSNESLKPTVERKSSEAAQPAPNSADLQNKEVLSDKTHTQSDSRPTPTQPSNSVHETYWLPIPSLVLGICSCVVLLDESQLDVESIAYQLFASAGALVLGIRSLTTQKKGKKMAIAGIVMGTIAILGGISLLLT